MVERRSVLQTFTSVFLEVFCFCVFGGERLHLLFCRIFDLIGGGQIYVPFDTQPTGRIFAFVATRVVVDRPSSQTGELKSHSCWEFHDIILMQRTSSSNNNQEK